MTNQLMPTNPAHAQSVRKHPAPRSFAASIQVSSDVCGILSCAICRSIGWRRTTARPPSASACVGNVRSSGPILTKCVDDAGIVGLVCNVAGERDDRGAGSKAPPTPPFIRSSKALARLATYFCRRKSAIVRGPTSGGPRWISENLCRDVPPARAKPAISSLAADVSKGRRSGSGMRVAARSVLAPNVSFSL